MCQVIPSLAFDTIINHLLLILFRKRNIIEQKSMITSHKDFRHIIRFMNLMYQHFQFFNRFPTTIYHICRRSIMTFFIYCVVHDIYQRMFEDFTVLLLIIGCHFLIIHTNGIFIILG